MTILQSVLLGVLQGVAEFLPISSSGHLAVAQKIFHLEEIPLLFDVMLHVSSLLAVVIVFRKKIWSLLKTFGRLVTRKTTSDDSAEVSMIFAIIAGTIVTGAMGIILSKLIPDLPIQFVFVGFIVTALLLIAVSIATARSTRNMSDTVSWKQGLFVGLAQGIGVLPGISRSGITIASSMFCGIDRATAGEFSFLLSIPAILGAFVLELKDLGELSEAISILPIAIGCVASFVAGFFSLKFLLRLIKKGRLEYFAYYLIPLAILGFIFLRNF